MDTAAFICVALANIITSIGLMLAFKRIAALEAKAAGSGLAQPQCGRRSPASPQSGGHGDGLLDFGVEEQVELDTPTYLRRQSSKSQSHRQS